MAAAKQVVAVEKQVVNAYINNKHYNFFYSKSGGGLLQDDLNIFCSRHYFDRMQHLLLQQALFWQQYLFFMTNHYSETQRTAAEKQESAANC